jgi:hypothetical protein
LACEICWVEALRPSLRLYLASSLIWSRLFFNIQTLIITVSGLRVLNAAYMRVLRRVAGLMRFDTNACSDCEVRDKLLQPSIDCVLVRKRLAYAAPLAQKGPPVLVMLLADEHGGRPIPWCRQL